MNSNRKPTHFKNVPGKRQLKRETARSGTQESSSWWPGESRAPEVCLHYIAGILGRRLRPGDVIPFMCRDLGDRTDLYTRGQT
jgi:hypothetical protein